MRQVEIFTNLYDQNADNVYAVISDFQQYPEQCAAVRTVDILEHSPEYSISKWEVNFRQGILQWTEKDYFDFDKKIIHFEQIEGDAAHFSGQWQVYEIEGGCQIRFTADFDMGIPTMRDIIEPIAERALNENIRSIVSGLFLSSDKPA